MTIASGYAWVTLSVTDLERSVTWYRQVFELEVLMSNADTCAIADEDRFVYLVEPSTLLVVGLQKSAANDGRRFAPESTGLSQVVLTPGTGGLDGCLARLDQLGIPHGGPTEWKTGRVVEISDPDGIALLVFEPSLAAGRRAIASTGT